MFVGRADELTACGRALEDAPALLLLVGPSGAGKSALLARVAADLRDRRGALVLHGRCYAGESVPYKALDGVVEALAQHLETCSPRHVFTCMAEEAADLRRVFPALHRVVGAVGLGEPADAAPRETRRRAVAALRRLLAELAGARPIVLAIDDLQWGDADSARLLGELLAPPDPPPIVVAASVRSDARPGSAFFAELDAAPLACPIHEVELAPLGPVEAERMAATILAEGPGRGDDPGLRQRLAAAIARESQGSPLFIEAMAQRLGDGAEGRDLARRRAAGRGRRARARRAARARAPGGRRPALAPRPRAAPRARGRGRAGARRRRPGGPRRAPAGPPVRRGRQRRDLPRPGPRGRAAPPRRRRSPRPPPRPRPRPRGRPRPRPRRAGAALPRRRRPGAGQPLGPARGGAGRRRPRVHPGRRPVRASSVLGDISKRTCPQVHRRPRRRAGVRRPLRRGGARLAHRRRAGPGPPAGARAARPRRRALPRVRPRRRRPARARPAGARARPAVPGHLGRHRAAPGRRARPPRYRPSPGPREPVAAEAVAAELRLRIDLCWSAGKGLGFIDPIRAAAISAQGLRLALASGEPRRIARAAAYLTIVDINAPDPRRASAAARELALARGLATRLSDPHLTGLTTILTGVAALNNGQWRRALTGVESGADLLRARCVDVHWERAIAHAMAMHAHLMLGDFARLRARAEAWQHEAEDIGDRFALVVAILYTAHAAVAAGEPARPRGCPQGPVPWPYEGFSFQHWLALGVEVDCDLYDGRGREAWARVERAWPALVRSQLMRMQIPGSTPTACAPARPWPPPAPASAA
ncbi:AAA family ATPase [Nannocystis pusilla]|uniref:AAA family ATPase n=1 Tax=Nannocystis pusilla TaxID=889268 RepID=UPI003B7E7000